MSQAVLLTIGWFALTAFIWWILMRWLRSSRVEVTIVKRMKVKGAVVAKDEKLFLYWFNIALLLIAALTMSGILIFLLLGFF